MRREANSRYAILGLLMIEPMSGYDLRKHFQESLSYFWSESYGRIYPTLKQLANEGLVRVESGASSGNRERQVYTVTTKGLAALRDWLMRKPQKQPPRNEFLLKLFLGNALPLRDLLRHFADFRAEQESLLAMYIIIRDSVREEHTRSPHLPYWMLSLDHGIRMRRAEIKWANDAIRILKRYERRVHSAPTGRALK